MEDTKPLIKNSKSQSPYAFEKHINAYIPVSILKWKVVHQNSHKIKASCDPFSLQHYEFPTYVSLVKSIKSLSNA